MITIYHNPRCSKSREGLAFLESKGLEYKIIKYLDEPLTKAELVSLLHKLNYTPIELVRTKEAVWKENYANRKLSDDDIIEALVENPRLIERPIVIKGNKAVVARPTDKIGLLL